MGRSIAAKARWPNVAQLLRCFEHLVSLVLLRVTLVLQKFLRVAFGRKFEPRAYVHEYGNVPNSVCIVYTPFCLGNGTGVLIEHKGQQAVLTCRHVILATKCRFPFSDEMFYVKYACDVGHDVDLQLLILEKTIGYQAEPMKIGKVNPKLSCDLLGYGSIPVLDEEEPLWFPRSSVFSELCMFSKRVHEFRHLAYCHGLGRSFITIPSHIRTLPGTPGCSGGPVVQGDKVVGIHAAGTNMNGYQPAFGVSIHVDLAKYKQQIRSVMEDVERHKQPSWSLVDYLLKKFYPN